MIELDQLCRAPAAALTLNQIRQRCVNLEALWEPSALNVTMAIVAGVLVALFVLIRRVKNDEGAGWVVLNTLEGLIYGALGAWFGAIAGQALALVLPPGVFGVMMLVFAGLSLLVMVAALIKGDGGGEKALGFFTHVALAGALIAIAIVAFDIPSRRAANAFERYLLVSGIVFALTGFAGALVVSLYRGYHWSVGWLLVPINAAWGALGNLLGLMNHFACLFCFKDWGQPNERRRWYVRYDGGFNLKKDYDFTEGDAMSGNNVESHEATHVLQHFLFGPIYPLSHAAWVVAMFIPGLIAGAIAKDRNVGQGIVDFTYFNNPWEVIAYAVDGRRNDGEAKQPLIFNDIAAWIVTVIWVGTATALTIVYLVNRLD